MPSARRTIVIAALTVGISAAPAVLTTAQATAAPHAAAKPKAATWPVVKKGNTGGRVRAIQYFVYPDPDPATLVWSAHAGFFWRCWTCALPPPYRRRPILHADRVGRH